MAVVLSHLSLIYFVYCIILLGKIFLKAFLSKIFSITLFLVFSTLEHLPFLYFSS